MNSVSRWHCDTELESGTRIPETPRPKGKSAEYGIPIAIQCRYGTQYGIPHSPRIAIRNWNTEPQVTLRPNLIAVHAPNRPSECSDEDGWVAHLQVDNVLGRFLSVHAVKRSYPDPSSLRCRVSKTEEEMEVERNSPSNHKSNHMCCLEFPFY